MPDKTNCLTPEQLDLIESNVQAGWGMHPNGTAAIKQHSLLALVATARENETQAARIVELEAERDALRAVVGAIHALRNNVVATQNAGWSNHFYPTVAILKDAGYEYEEPSEEAVTEHLKAYHGAGNYPRVRDVRQATRSLREVLDGR